MILAAKEEILHLKSELVSIDISPVEADIDARFRDMYQKSLRRR